MVLRLSNVLKIIGVVVMALVVVVVSAAGVRKLASQKNDSNSDDQNSSSVEAAGPDAIRFNRPDVVKSLGIQVAKAEKAMQADRKQEKHGRQLILRGTLGPDTDRYVQVRPRFGGDCRIWPTNRCRRRRVRWRRNAAPARSDAPGGRASCGAAS